MFMDNRSWIDSTKDGMTDDTQSDNTDVPARQLADTSTCSLEKSVPVPSGERLLHRNTALFTKNVR